MPRIAKDKKEGVVKEAALPPAVALPGDALNPGDRSAKAKQEYQPYTGRDSLPEAKKDSKGKVIGPGEPRYFCYPVPGGVDFVAKYKKRSGVGQRLVKILKDKNKTDKLFRTHLRKLGIPGA